MINRGPKAYVERQKVYLFTVQKFITQSLHTRLSFYCSHHIRKHRHFSFGLSRQNVLKCGLTLKPYAYRGPWPGEERYTDGKQPPAARARLSNSQTLYNTVQCSILEFTEQ